MANIVITPTEFTVGNDIIINGIIDDSTVTLIDVNGSSVALTDGTFSLNLGQLDAQAYSLPITISDGDSVGETINIEFTVSAAQEPEETPSEGETPPEETPPEGTEPEVTPPEIIPPEIIPPEIIPPEITPPDTTPPEVTPPEGTEPEETPPSQSVITDDGKYTGVTEHGSALEDQEFYGKIMEGFGSNKFVPDYIPNKKIPVAVDEIKTTLGGDPLYNPIETLDQRFPPRRNLKDSHSPLFGEMYHPDMIDKSETPIKEVDRYTTSSIGTSGFTI